MKQTMLEYVKDYIQDKLPEIESQANTYASTAELAHDICSRDFDNGTILMNEKLALETICNWKYEAGAFIDALQSSGTACANPFWRPGLFHVALVEFGVADLLSQMKCFPEEPFTVSPETTAAINEELNDLTDFTFNR